MSIVEYLLTCRYFTNYEQSDYARGGNIATETITLPEGPLFRGEEPIPHNMELQLRGLGLPTKLDNGVVKLTKATIISTEGMSLVIRTPSYIPLLFLHCSNTTGKKLTKEQAQLLKIFYHHLATFKVTLRCVWSEDKGIENLGKDEEMEE